MTRFTNSFFSFGLTRCGAKAILGMALLVLVCGLAAGVSMSSGAVAASNADAPKSGTDVCARMGEAMLKTAKTPYKSVSIITLERAASGDAKDSSNSRTSETIFTGNAVFVRSGGGPWRKINAEVGTLQELVRKAASRLTHCQDLGADKLDGTPVAVLSAEEGDKAYETATKLWVDQARGTLTRSASDTKTKEGTRHSRIEYKYESVSAPQL